MELFVSEIGLTDLTWQEISAWMQATRTHVSRWEAVALREMAASYQSAIVQYDQKNEPAPWVDKDFDRDAVANQMRRALRG